MCLLWLVLFVSSKKNNINLICTVLLKFQRQTADILSVMLTNHVTFSFSCHVTTLNFSYLQKQTLTCEQKQPLMITDYNVHQTGLMLTNNYLSLSFSSHFFPYYYISLQILPDKFTLESCYASRHQRCKVWSRLNNYIVQCSTQTTDVSAFVTENIHRQYCGF